MIKVLGKVCLVRHLNKAALPLMQNLPVLGVRTVQLILAAAPKVKMQYANLAPKVNLRYS
jgi:hypothetical protein